MTGVTTLGAGEAQGPVEFMENDTVGSLQRALGWASKPETQVCTALLPEQMSKLRPGG